MAQMTYRERRIARAERLRGWAEKREEKAAAAYQAARAIGDNIPFGQPILVGHHSERRMRRDIGRIDGNMRRSVENSAKAEEMKSKAENILTAAEHAIYSDDADAIERLAAKLAELEAERGSIKAYNASCRKGAADTSLLTGKQRENLESVKRYTAYNVGRNGEMPGYVLTNLGGNINRAKKRLESMKRRRGA